MKIYRWNPAADGTLTAESACARFHDTGYTCACYIYPPGTVFPEHTHEMDKIDLVLKGRFLINMDGKEYILRAGDYVVIPRGTIHRAAVIGGEEVISVDAEKLSAQE